MTTTTTAAPALGFALMWVDDVDVSCRYLSEQLGLVREPGGDGEGFRQFAAGSGGIGFGLIATGPQGPQAGAVRFYFYTPDVEELRATLTERTVAVGEIQHMPFGTIFDVPSPNGEPPMTMMQPQ
jgi:hypothetical protein